MKNIIKKIVPYYFIKKWQQYKLNKKNKVFLGNKVHCLICHSNFNEFASFGNPSRKNARCYNCGSLDRHRLIWKYINEKTNFTNVNTKLKMLHFAPEKCFFDIFINAQNIDYTPCDLNPETFNIHNKSVIKKVDILNIPFNNNSFDVVFCSHVLEHIIDDKKAMQELYRVMKIGAWGIFQVPMKYDLKNTYEDFTITTPQERLQHFGQEDHVRWYGQDYSNRLRNVGFTVLEDNYVNTFTKKDQFKYGFRENELIYFCTK